MGSIQSIYKRLNSGFFAFWITNWKVSILFSLLILFLGVFSMFQIPKESSPEIEFGIVNIVTVYPGVGPVDMDELITQEIEDAIKDIEGIDAIESASRVGVANTTITLENGVDTANFINEVRTKVDSVQLPDEAEDPIVNEISPTEDLIFQAILYGDETLYPKQALLEIARQVQDELELENYVGSVDIQGSSDYDIEILVDKAQVEQLGLSLSTIAQTIRSYNRNVPIGNYEVDTFKYDFRIQGELDSIQQLLEIPLITEGYTALTLGDISTLRRKYDNETVSKLGGYEQQGFNAVTLSISKSPSANIFDAASGTKERLEQLLTSQSFQGVQVSYANDLADQIQEDYSVLFNSGVQTFVFVFLCLLLFVGVKEALVANLGIILAFCVTFIVLNNGGYTLNFLTNFSLILTLGIAIDTSIVVIEAAYERMKLGFSPKTAALMAVRDFKAPLIAGTSTTLVVFIPMMVLPGITGKFLAYIPITVFITLLAALFVALTINVAWFYKLSKEKRSYIVSESLEAFLSDDDKRILENERQGKEEKESGQLSFKEKILEGLNSWYENFLRKYLKSGFLRWSGVILPFILMVASTVILGPILGFTLFPAGDNSRLDLSITGPVGQTTETMAQRVPYIEPTLTQFIEIEQYDLTVNGNAIAIGIELTDKDDRQASNQRSVFELEEEINDKLAFLVQEGLEFESKALAGGPPQDKPVAIKLIAQRGDQFDQLLTVANDFENYLKSVEGTRNVGISSQRTPGQFIYEYDTVTISRLGITPSQAASSIASALNGMSAGAITIDNEERTIKVLLDEFADTVTPTDIGNIVIQTPTGPVAANEFISYRIDNAVAEISREDEKITVTVQSDLQPELVAQAGVINQELVKWAEQQQLPAGISFEKGGEGQENADLINAAVQGLIISIFLIFAILVLQFNSFARPMIILYSVICALLGVNIGLYLTGNPYSMSMGIGFIALTGIVVNDAIVLLDRIQQNLKHGASNFEAIVEAGRSRLQPIILTTMTTLLGILPISLQDEFWAGLGFTMIFGLFAGSALTLTAIPSLYMIFFVKKEDIPS